MDTPTQEPPPSPPSDPGDPLAALAEASRAQRLAPAEEERAVALLREKLAGGKAGIGAALDPMLLLPWAVSVHAVSAAWPELSLPMKRFLLATLAKSEAEPARRLRLSVARAVFKLDPAAGLKIAAAAAADLQEPESGALPPRHRQMFFHVFIGKGKPWLLQLPLADLKGAEADALVHAAIETFSLCPPLSQLSILRWIHGAGRFKKMTGADLAAVIKAVGRWNPKLQRQLAAEIPDLPEAITAVFKPQPVPPPPAPVPAEEPAEEKKAEPARQATPATPETPAAEAEKERKDRKERDRAERPVREGREERERREPREPRDGREGREPERAERTERGRKAFDLKESLRALETYVHGLKSELEQAKTQLRRREDDFKRGRPARAERGEERRSPDAESLARHNAQLEATVRELRQQLDDLASHHEAVAESRGLHGGEPLPEGDAESLRVLLAIKLQESYETYHAMRLDPLDRVFRLDYRDLLGSVFDVLLHEGVRLEKKE